VLIGSAKGVRGVSGEGETGPGTEALNHACSRLLSVRSYVGVRSPDHGMAGIKWMPEVVANALSET
jgi:hypothetical protein